MFVLGKYSLLVERRIYLFMASKDEKKKLWEYSIQVGEGKKEFAAVANKEHKS